MPVLVARSTASYEKARRVDGGLHDLTLSPTAVRDRLFDAVRTWLGAYFPRRGD